MSLDVMVPLFRIPLFEGALAGKDIRCQRGDRRISHIRVVVLISRTRLGDD